MEIEGDEVGVAQVEQVTATTRNLPFCNCRMQLVFSCMRHMQLQFP